ncbi:MAG TPA: LPS assembly lipoprotein LptE [Burkholderiales bacterium]|nr:LPS assembly lipoprotein LptE [Burkholderiales bacterium]
MKFTPLKRISIAAFCLSVAACGFHLRGQATLPFDTLYVSSDNDSAFATELKRAVRAGTNARLIDNPKDADAIFQVQNEARERRILAINTGGTVAEYELRLYVTFRLYNNKGQNWIAPTELTLKRNVSYNDSTVLAKDYEEAQLYKDMQSDAVQQVLQRMSGAKAPI